MTNIIVILENDVKTGWQWVQNEAADVYGIGVKIRATAWQAASEAGPMFGACGFFGHGACFSR